MQTQRLKPSNPAQFYALLAAHRFELIDYQNRQMFWKQSDGRHIIIEVVGEENHKAPNWKTRRVQMSIYRGPVLLQNQLHQETAYIIDDLEEFLKDLKEGKIHAESY
jgi:hypothetical protein